VRTGKAPGRRCSGFLWRELRADRASVARIDELGRMPHPMFISKGGEMSMAGHLLPSADLNRKWLEINASRRGAVEPRGECSVIDGWEAWLPAGGCVSSCSIANAVLSGTLIDRRRCWRTSGSASIARGPVDFGALRAMAGLDDNAGGSVVRGMTVEVPIPDDLIPRLVRRARSAGLDREHSTKFRVAFAKRSQLAAYRTQSWIRCSNRPGMTRSPNTKDLAGNRRCLDNGRGSCSTA